VHGKDYDFRWLEERLLALGFHLVFCTRKQEAFEEARRQRIQVSGNPAQYDNLHDFIEEQNFFRRLIGSSLLPFLEVDVSDNDVQKATNRIADWLETTEGLWAPEKKKEGGKD
jgi:transcriptional/translational regulatory protein YebC/TACO1